MSIGSWLKYLCMCTQKLIRNDRFEIFVLKLYYSKLVHREWYPEERPRSQAILLSDKRTMPAIGDRVKGQVGQVGQTGQTGQAAVGTLPNPQAVAQQASVGTLPNPQAIAQQASVGTLPNPQAVQQSTGYAQQASVGTLPNPQAVQQAQSTGYTQSTNMQTTNMATSNVAQTYETSQVSPQELQALMWCICTWSSSTGDADARTGDERMFAS